MKVLILGANGMLGPWVSKALSHHEIIETDLEKIPSNIKKNDILGHDAEYNAKAFIDMIESPNNSFQKIVELNTGAALYISGLAINLKEGFELARQTIASKKSKKYFENLLKNQ